MSDEQNTIEILEGLRRAGRMIPPWENMLDILTSSPIISDMGKKRKRQLAVSDQLRQHVDSCGLTRYEIAKRTGIDESALSRFMSGERGLSMKALDVLGAFLDLVVVMHGPSDS